MRWQVWAFAIRAILASVYIHSHAKQLIEISVSSGPSGQDKTLKNRMVFLVTLEKAFHKKGWLASFNIEGDDGKTIKIYWEQLKLPFVKHLVGNHDIIADLREMGFKFLIMTDGKTTWNVDLKN
jgi:hypothetical protein